MRALALEVGDNVCNVIPDDGNESIPVKVPVANP